MIIFQNFGFIPLANWCYKRFHKFLLIFTSRCLKKSTLFRISRRTRLNPATIYNVNIPKNLNESRYKLQHAYPEVLLPFSWESAESMTFMKKCINLMKKWINLSQRAAQVYMRARREEKRCLHALNSSGELCLTVFPSFTRY